MNKGGNYVAVPYKLEGVTKTVHGQCSWKVNKATA